MHTLTPKITCHYFVPQSHFPQYTAGKIAPVIFIIGIVSDNILDCPVHLFYQSREACPQWWLFIVFIDTWEPTEEEIGGLQMDKRLFHYLGLVCHDTMGAGKVKFESVHFWGKIYQICNFQNNMQNETHLSFEICPSPTNAYKNVYIMGRCA